MSPDGIYVDDVAYVRGLENQVRAIASLLVPSGPDATFAIEPERVVALHGGTIPGSDACGRSVWGVSPDQVRGVSLQVYPDGAVIRADNSFVDAGCHFTNIGPGTHSRDVSALLTCTAHARDETLRDGARGAWNGILISAERDMSLGAVMPSIVAAAEWDGDGADHRPRIALGELQ